MPHLRSLNPLKVNLAASWIVHLVVMLIGVYLMPFVLHTIGDSSYGTWIFINSIAGYAGLMYLGFGATISRYVATFYAQQDWKRLNEVVNVIFVIYLCMGAITVSLACLLAWLAPHLFVPAGTSLGEMRGVIVLLGLNIAVGLAGSVFGGVLMGIQRFDVERGIILAAALLRLGLTVWFLHSQQALLTLAVIALVVTIAENLGQVAYAFRKVPLLSIRWRHVRFSTGQDFFTFSGYAFLDAVAFRVLEITDTVIIGLILGARAIVPYYIALRLSQFIGRPIAQIGRVSMPRAGELNAMADNRRLHELVGQCVGLSFLLATGFYIGAGFFGGTLIETWVGPGYHISHVLLIILLAAQIVSVPVGVLRSVLFGMGQVRVPALLYLAEAIANVLLSLILIGPFGVVGVAIGTVIPIIVMELGLLIPYANRLLGFSAGEFIRNALVPQIVPLLALLAYAMAISYVAPPSSDWLSLAATTLGGGVALLGGWCAFHFRQRFLNLRVVSTDAHPG